MKVWKLICLFIVVFGSELQAESLPRLKPANMTFGMREWSVLGVIPATLVVQKSDGTQEELFGRLVLEHGGLRLVPRMCCATKTMLTSVALSSSALGVGFVSGEISRAMPLSSSLCAVGTMLAGCTIGATILWNGFQKAVTETLADPNWQRRIYFKSLKGEHIPIHFRPKEPLEFTVQLLIGSRAPRLRQIRGGAEEGFVVEGLKLLIDSKSDVEKAFAVLSHLSTGQRKSVPADKLLVLTPNSFSCGQDLTRQS